MDVEGFTGDRCDGESGREKGLGDGGPEVTGGLLRVSVLRARLMNCTRRSYTDDDNVLDGHV